MHTWHARRRNLRDDQMTHFEKKILSIPLVASVLRLTKRISLPGLDGIPIYDILDFFFKQARKIGFSERSAAISFNIIMALPGLLLFLITLVPLMPQSVAFKEQLMVTLNDIVRHPQLHLMISDVINDLFTTKRSGIMWLSVIIIIFFSSNAMMGIMHTFDRSFFEERSSRFMAKRWMALKLTALLILLILTSLLLLMTQGSIKIFILDKLGWNFGWLKSVIDYSRWIVIFGLTYFAIAFIYRYGPAVKVKWSLRSPGAVLATLLVILVSYLFSLWVTNFANYNKLYGSIGTIIIFMNIIYINSLILIIGFEVNVGITSIKVKSEKRMADEDLSISD
jgi:membrane protein